MNSTIQTLLNHKTIRSYHTTPIKDDVFKTLLDVASRTATSSGMQQASIIHVKDQSKKEIIAQVCKQDYVAIAPILLIFVVDQHRNHHIAMEVSKNASQTHDVDRFFQGFTDACLMAQSVVTAAESLGLGTTYLGAIHNDDETVIKTLNLPSLTYPVVGLLIGHPNIEPTLKPRLENSLRVFEDEYVSHREYLPLLKTMDVQMQNYVDTRNPGRTMPAFSQQVSERMNYANPIRLKMGKNIIKQGFSFNLDE
jgi:nitroreductase